MKIEYLGHASFLITTNAGTRILTDPFDPSKYPDSMTYSVFDQAVDIVTVSHEHNDHKAIYLAKGSPIIIRGNGKFVAEEVEFVGVETFHDPARGEQRGENTVFIVSVDGIRVAHMGDLGHVLTSDQAAEIGSADVVLIPVGGYYTIDAAQAAKVADQIAARIVIPMHYRTEKCTFPIAGVEDFVKDKPNVTRQGGSILEVTADTLPDKQQIIVLDPAL